MSTSLTINGFPIIAHFDFPKRQWTRMGRVILVDRGEQGRYAHRYVVSAQFTNEVILTGETVFDNSWYQGHYFQDLPAARQAFAEEIFYWYPETEKKKEAQKTALV